MRPLEAALVDLSTFERLAATQIDSLYGYAARLAQDREAAAELVQDSLERALRYRAKIKEEAALRPLLFRILQNLHRDRWRASQREPELYPLEEPEEFAGPECIEAALSEEVEQALAELHHSWRATLWLIDVEGFSYEETAQITEVPVGTVRSRLSRARRLMARRLAEYARKRGLVREVTPA